MTCLLYARYIGYGRLKVDEHVKKILSFADADEGMIIKSEY